MTNTLTYPAAERVYGSLDRPTESDRNKLDASGELKQQTIELIAAYRQSQLPYLRERIVRLNLGLARKEAHYWANQCQENFEDLLQVGSIGLIAAIDKFDLEKGYAFSTFANPALLAG
jgi:RNA polymerase sigma-B factor